MTNPELFEPNPVLEHSARTDGSDVAGGTRPVRGRRRRIIVGTVVALALLTAGLAIVLARRLQPQTAVAALVGQRAPAFFLDGLETETGRVSLASFEGRPVVINFWASWCVPCRTEMPALEAVHAQLGDRVGFVGIDHLDDRRSALRLIADTGVTYESGFDPQGTVAANYGLYGLPTTLLVSADGVVMAMVTGAVTESSLLSMIQDRLGVPTD